MDTIFALATAPGRAGVAIIRVSGSEISRVMDHFDIQVPENGRRLAQLKGSDGLIDEALVLRFAKGHSFTGDDVLEIQCHGSRAVVALILYELDRISGCRLAQPGEFTRRAFENGRLSLDQIEALADLIDAETEQQRKFAVRFMSGAMRHRADGWRQNLTKVGALLMAGIDFADEEIPESVIQDACSGIETLISEMKVAIQASDGVERVREGFEVALIGAPNAGKSTLLNYLAGRDAAITSDIAGTTRDVIEVQMDISGIPVTLLDTAGIREASDPVEKIGIDRTVDRAIQADLRVFLDTGVVIGGLAKDGDITVPAKADLGDGIGVSGLTGQGVEDLLGNIGEVLRDRVPSSPVFGRQRQIDCVSIAIDDLTRAKGFLYDDVSLSAHHVSCAGGALDALVGAIGVEDLLDEVFSSFCIGK